jgi:hypothetical protein
MLCRVFYLLAGVPMRRPYNDSITALSGGPSPSGIVAGGGAGGCGINFFILVGGEGLGCALKNHFRALFVKFEGLVVILFLLWSSI